MKEILEKLFSKTNLTHVELWDVFTKMMRGEMSEAQISALLTALRAKGESVDEISIVAEILRDFSEPVHLNHPESSIDTCGTGGSRYKTFNVSTAIAFVLAAGGVTVAKHGNRSNSGKSGSSDVLTALGVNISASKEETEKKINEGGIGFMFAPLYHPAMKYVAPVRKDIQIRTIFNLVGPLANPARVQRQVLGVFDESYIEPFIFALQKLGHKKAIVVHGVGGFDEFSLTGESRYALLENGQITMHLLSPEELGLKRANLADLEGGDAQVNAKILESILKGEEQGAKANLVALNAAAGFFVADAVTSIAEGVSLAQKVLKSGKAYEKLEYLKSS